jgi:hypothetical protein
VQYGRLPTLAPIRITGSVASHAAGSTDSHAPWKITVLRPTVIRWGPKTQSGR